MASAAATPIPVRLRTACLSVMQPSQHKRHRSFIAVLSPAARAANCTAINWVADSPCAPHVHLICLTRAWADVAAAWQLTHRTAQSCTPGNLTAFVKISRDLVALGDPNPSNDRQSNQRHKASAVVTSAQGDRLEESATARAGLCSPRTSARPAPAASAAQVSGRRATSATIAAPAGRKAATIAQGSNQSRFTAHTPRVTGRCPQRRASH